ncbi:MAG: methylenetetrahydrofolate reductase [NAD(P)H] [Desulfobulbaceae bacterium]|uniref:Methylenetetrahydrofolate reductase n=1 Tax=Candidatus Desulfatifera sulfidica TaxID=2841691 RepID=A0A8J6N992_9BACT|nr:methylenetetrahydrofolate reductase [NAD(P)H] [Candidatus Desulfatifera sulfidica]
MLVKDLLKKHKTTFSFEFFPPKEDAAADRLLETISNLMPLGPSYVSVTYGAGGSTRDRTHDLVVRIKEKTNITVVSHLTCVGSSRAEIHTILEKYNKAGINNILALRGDQPQGTTSTVEQKDGFDYASDLVAYIKKHFPGMCVGVAGFPEGHPGTPNRLQEIDYLKAKVDAGADYIVSQLFFDNRDFYDYCERCELAGIHVPNIAGIMPVTSKSGLIRTAELAGGARIPARLLRAVYRAEDDDYVKKVGIHWATEQIRDLLDNDVRGIQFFTLNSSTATQEIYSNLGVRDSSRLRTA